VIKWPSALISDIARRRCVVVLGAGVSRNSVNDDERSPRTWAEFLESAMAAIQPRKHLQGLLKREDYLTLCELLRQSYGQDAFNTLVIEEFLTPAYHHAPLHEAVFKLDSRIVATPNFDKIYETYASHAAHGSIRVKHYYDPDIAEAIRRSDRVILKIHGSIDSPGMMIFTRADYAAARAAHPGFYSTLEALAVANTFLFLGCGTSDPDIRLLLEDTLFRHPGARPHVMVLPRGTMHKDIAAVLSATMNVSMLEYSAANSHRELTDSVFELAAAVEAERENLRESLNW
jgi:hypothetical protein